MIPPWGRRGKGIGFADRPVVPAVPRPREPIDRLATEAARAAQDSSHDELLAGPTAPWIAWARSTRLHASSETNVCADSSFVGLAAAVLLYLFAAATSRDFVLAFAAAAIGSDSVFFGLQRMI